MNTRTTTTLALLLAASAPLAVLGQNILTNGSFEQNDFFIERDGFPRLDDVNGSTPTGWTRDSFTLAEYMTRSPEYLGLTIYNPEGGNYFIGAHNDEWWEQTFATVPGTRYFLTYWSAYGAVWDSSSYFLPGSSPGLVTVTGTELLLSAELAGTSPAPTGTTLQDSPFVWSQHTETFIADTNSAALRFAGPADVGGYLFVDDVSVTATNELRVTIDLYPGISLSGSIGSTNRIEYVSQLGATNWTLLTNVVIEQLPTLFIDPTPARNQRFYRVVAVQ